LVYFTAIFVAIWSILRPFGIFCGHLVYFVAIWYILWLFGIFFPVLVCFTNKNLATLVVEFSPEGSGHDGRSARDEVLRWNR
jgi:hypothetical protein